MTKKKIIIGIIILIIVAGTGFILRNKLMTNSLNNNTNQTNNVPQKTIIKIARSSVAISAFPLFVSQEKGFFSENGLEVQLETMKAPESVPALLAKEVDYISFAIEAVAASQKDEPIKVIMAYGKNSCLAMATQPKLKISNIKKIAVSNLLTPPHYQALKFIHDNKLSAEVIATGESPGIVIAMLKNKQADAAIQSVIAIIGLKDSGYTFLKTFYDEELPQGLATTDEKIQNNPGEIKKVIKSIQSSLQFIQNNPDETKTLLLKFSRMEINETNQKIVEEAYPVIKQTFTVGNVPSQEGINNLIKLGKAGVYKTFQDITKQTVSEADIAKSFDFRFVENNGQ